MIYHNTMNVVDFTSLLLEKLNGKLVSNNTEINCRCRYCPDSKNPKHAHFYIGIPHNNDGGFVYHCKLCNSSGYINTNVLIEWGIIDSPGALLWLNKYNRSINKNSNGSMLYKRDRYTKMNVYNTLELVDNTKLDYLSNRIGYKLSSKDAHELKIITNLKDLIDYNNLEYTRNYNILNILNNEFIGFMSYDNTAINCRKIHNNDIDIKSINKRYVNYRVFKDMSVGMNTYYVLPFQIDLIKPINIHISEGPIDILSIYFNLRNRDNGVYISCGGKSYINVIKYVMELLLVPNVFINIYADNDVSDNYFIDQIKPYVNTLKLETTIHRNIYSNEKDFGVPINKIKEIIYRI